MAGQSTTFRDDEADDGADDAPAGLYPSNTPAMERGGNVSLLSEFNRPAPGEEPRAPRAGTQQEAEENYEVVDVDDSGRPVGQPREREAAVTQDDDDTYLQRQQRETAQRGIDARRVRDQAEAEKLGLTLRQYKRHQERQGRDRSRSEIARLQAELSQVTQRLNSVVEPRLAEMQEGRLRQSVADLDRQRNEMLGRANAEMRAFTQATLAQDEDGMARALAARDQAIMQATRLEAQRNMLATGNPQGFEQGGGQGQPQRGQAQQQPEAQYDAATERLAAEFKADHPWINFRQAYVNGVVQEVPADQDTEILSAIDKRVMQEGFRPNTVAYWDELERRAAMYLPHRFIQDQGDVGQNEPPPRQTPPRREAAPQQRREAVPPSAQRRGPPVAGGNENAGGNAGGGNRVYLNPARKEALVLAGAMDTMGRVSNKDTYNRYMRSYAKYDRENNVVA